MSNQSQLINTFRDLYSSLGRHRLLGGVPVACAGALLVVGIFAFISIFISSFLILLVVLAIAFIWGLRPQGTTFLSLYQTYLSWKERHWFLLSAPSALLSLLFTLTLLALTAIFTIGCWTDLGGVHFPWPLGWLLAEILSAPGIWSAMATAGFLFFFGRIGAMFQAPQDRDEAHMASLKEVAGIGRLRFSHPTTNQQDACEGCGWLFYLGHLQITVLAPSSREYTVTSQQRNGLGRSFSVIITSAFSVPYTLWAIGLYVTWIGFREAERLLGTLYAYPAVLMVLLTAYAYAQWMRKPLALGQILMWPALLLLLIAGLFLPALRQLPLLTRFSKEEQTGGRTTTLPLIIAYAPPGISPLPAFCQQNRQGLANSFLCSCRREDTLDLSSSDGAGKPYQDWERTVRNQDVLTTRALQGDRGG